MSSLSRDAVYIFDSCALHNSGGLYSHRLHCTPFVHILEPRDFLEAKTFQPPHQNLIPNQMKVITPPKAQNGSSSVSNLTSATEIEERHSFLPSSTCSLPHQLQQYHIFFTLTFSYSSVKYNKHNPLFLQINSL